MTPEFGMPKQLSYPSLSFEIMSPPHLLSLETIVRTHGMPGIPQSPSRAGQTNMQQVQNEKLHQAR